eukprot:SAG31_NODE_39982_length_284_cov_0.816216_1_plen_52_part_01
MLSPPRPAVLALSCIVLFSTMQWRTNGLADRVIFFDMFTVAFLKKDILTNL